ncbi:MAG TPA: hypothetical protein VLH40_07855 [Atribacteraceae bacterium]|nr:hypothetical protein [Atribacteraceae bacterium]
MKTVLAFLLVILLAGGVMAQELVMEKTPSEVVVFGNEQGLFVREIWPVNLTPGRNDLRWERPAGVSLEDVYVSVKGAGLLTVLSPLDNSDDTITLLAEERGTGQLVLIYPLTEVTLSFLYQFDWEKNLPVPQGTLFAEIRNLSSRSWVAERFVLGGMEIDLDLAPFQTKRVNLQDFSPVLAERYAVYDRHRFGDSDVRFFWRIQLPENLVYPGKMECFEESAAGMVFLGEGTYAADSPETELMVGAGTDLVVEETIVHREKHNQVFSKKGREVLYDTEETKLYTISNRGTETRIIEVYDTLRLGYELVGSSHPLIRQEAGRIAFRLTLEPQEKQVVTVEVQGKYLTGGFVF